MFIWPEEKKQRSPGNAPSRETKQAHSSQEEGTLRSAHLWNPLNKFAVAFTLDPGSLSKIYRVEAFLDKSKPAGSELVWLTSDSEIDGVLQAIGENVQSFLWELPERFLDCTDRSLLLALCHKVKIRKETDFSPKLLVAAPKSSNLSEPLLNLAAKAEKQFPFLSWGSSSLGDWTRI
jgi:hypothetical protein